MVTHPEEMVTAAYLDGTLPLDAREDFEAHLAACGPCRAGVSLLARRDDEQDRPPREMIEKARTEEAVVVLRPRTGGSGIRVPATLAAAAIVAVAIGLWLRGSWTLAPPPAPIERSDAGTLRALSPSPGAIIESGSLSFIWSAVEGADRYAVTVQDAEGRTIAAFESRRAGEPIVWPSESPRPAEGTYLWSVRALALDRVLAETRPIAFKVR